MAEGKLDPKVMKKTKDTLGKIIQRPPMTDKLLSKPPFRFLHDVMTSTVKTTGFMKGLFTEAELNSDNVKERDSKIAFLQKVIDMASLVLGKTIAAKPSKIVAGQEPDKTNEMLQCLADAINKKVNNDEYVKRTLKGGDSKPPSGSDKKKKSEDPEKKKRDKDDEKAEGSKDREKSRDRREKSSKDRDSAKSRDKDDSREKSRDHKDREKSKDRRDRDRSKDRGDRHRDKDREDRHRDKDDKHKDKDRRKHKEDKEGDQKMVNGEKHEEAPVRIPRPTSAKGSRRRHGHDDSTDEDPGGHRDDEDHIRERERSRPREDAVGEDDLPPQVAAARKMQRPGSARPAPPRAKKTDGHDEPVMMGSSNVPNLIVDKDDSDDDEDAFIAKDDEEAQPPVTMTTQDHDTDEEGEHGGLVKKILETKKELEGGSQQPGKKTEIERSHATDATRRKEREMIQKDIDKTRTSIQTLTRSVNPLGKILDFLQEDLDSMQKELVVWQAENKQNAVSLQREQSITESSVEPLKAQLTELDAAVNDQLDLIAAVKHNILKNDDKVEKMLSTVTKS